MLETAIVLFREGLEAFLIVAIMVAYVKKTGRDDLLRPIGTGVIIALIISATTGWHVAELAKDPVWEGSLALIAGLFVASFTILVMRGAQHARQEIQDSLDRKAQSTGVLADIGVLVFTILMISREGMEVALMLGALTGQEHPASMWMGALVGIFMVGAIGYLWIVQSEHINMKLFLQVTGIFLILFSLDLFLYGLHELSEMNAIPLIGEDMNVNFHIWTEAIENPIVSQILALGLIVVPCLWLACSYLKRKFARAE